MCELWPVMGAWTSLAFVYLVKPPSLNRLRPQPPTLISAVYCSGMTRTSSPRQDKTRRRVRCAPKKLNTAGRNAWAGQLGGRIHIYGDTADQFIDDLLPCSAPYMWDDNLVHDAFKAYTAGPGKEKLDCDNLVGVSHSHAYA